MSPASIIPKQLATMGFSIKELYTSLIEEAIRRVGEGLMENPLRT
jgi:hypothetical protein